MKLIPMNKLEITTDLEVFRTHPYDYIYNTLAAVHPGQLHTIYKIEMSNLIDALSEVDIQETLKRYCDLRQEDDWWKLKVYSDHADEGYQE